MKISDNQAQGSTYGWGGGLYLENGKLTASSGKICRNAADHGGGGYISTAILSGDVIISDNQVKGNGGGIYGNVTMSEQVRIEGNKADSIGGGV